MLVLNRRHDERIVIGGGLVTITVVEIRADKVRLGIEAPREISIHREEVYQQILLEKIGETKEDLRDLADVTRRAF